MLSFGLPSIGLLTDALWRHVPWHLVSIPFAGAAMDKPNPICALCKKPIFPTVPRYRRGLTSVHVECEDKKEDPPPRK